MRSAPAWHQPGTSPSPPPRPLPCAPAARRLILCGFRVHCLGVLTHSLLICVILALLACRGHKPGANLFVERLRLCMLGETGFGSGSGFDFKAEHGGACPGCKKLQAMPSVTRIPAEGVARRHQQNKSYCPRSHHPYCPRCLLPSCPHCRSPPATSPPRLGRIEELALLLMRVLSSRESWFMQT